MESNRKVSNLMAVTTGLSATSDCETWVFSLLLL